MPARALTSSTLRAPDARDRATGGADALVPPRRPDVVGHPDVVATSRSRSSEQAMLREAVADDRDRIDGTLRAAGLRLDAAHDGSCAARRTR